MTYLNWFEQTLRFLVSENYCKKFFHKAIWYKSNVILGRFYIGCAISILQHITEIYEVQAIIQQITWI